MKRLFSFALTIACVSHAFFPALKQHLTFVFIVAKGFLLEMPQPMQKEANDGLHR
ncbi:hypothetical protein [[Clostridium] innocuum]|uniref:hypothetical protein n=1 Tax=Clostridium innocuum TaxID=1522 RepID=UPI001C227F6B|nr:hypothetical protein [[Clostridium] innocuum]MCR0448008.1 hypothetical protein [[Clostridium] innocuum]MCR0497595.1 hypothetical protein [[Clostridium] innocuum]